MLGKQGLVEILVYHGFLKTTHYAKVITKAFWLYISISIDEYICSVVECGMKVHFT